MKKLMLSVGVVALSACGTNPIGRMLESEGIAAPAEAEKQMNAPPVNRAGYPVDDDAPASRPTLSGQWVSSWADPLFISQEGDRVFGKFDRNGTFDCMWNQKSRFDCTWKSDQGTGLAQLWWDTDRPAGHWVNKNWGDEWVGLRFSPWNDLERVQGGTSTSSSASGLGGACEYNQNCADPDTRCVNSKCVASTGTKCSIAGDCSSISNRYDCKRQVCTPR